MLPTRAFLAPMDEDEEIEVDLSKGNAVIIKYKALSELQPNGKRCISKCSTTHRRARLPSRDVYTCVSCIQTLNRPSGQGGDFPGSAFVIGCRALSELQSKVDM